MMTYTHAHSPNSSLKLIFKTLETKVQVIDLELQCFEDSSRLYKVKIGDLELKL